MSTEVPYPYAHAGLTTADAIEQPGVRASLLEVNEPTRWARFLARAARAATALRPDVEPAPRPRLEDWR